MQCVQVNYYALSFVIYSTYVDWTRDVGSVRAFAKTRHSRSTYGKLSCRDAYDWIVAKLRVELTVERTVEVKVLVDNKFLNKLKPAADDG